jgi:hypothetical protein
VADFKSYFWPAAGKERKAGAEQAENEGELATKRHADARKFLVTFGASLWLCAGVPQSALDPSIHPRFYASEDASVRGAEVA